MAALGVSAPRPRSVTPPPPPFQERGPAFDTTKIDTNSDTKAHTHIISKLTINIDIDANANVDVSQYQCQYQYLCQAQRRLPRSGTCNP